MAFLLSEMNDKVVVSVAPEPKEKAWYSAASLGDGGLTVEEAAKLCGFVIQFATTPRPSSGPMYGKQYEPGLSFPKTQLHMKDQQRSPTLSTTGPDHSVKAVQKEPPVPVLWWRCAQCPRLLVRQEETTADSFQGGIRFPTKPRTLIVVPVAHHLPFLCCIQCRGCVGIVLETYDLADGIPLPLDEDWVAFQDALAEAQVI